MDKKIMDVVTTLANKIATSFPAGATPLIGNINVFVIVQTNDDIKVETDVDVNAKVNTK
jgi:hypothetical protein